MQVIKNAFPLYDRCSNVHHGFMKALKMCISLFTRLSRIVMQFFETLTTRRCVFLKPSYNCDAHGSYAHAQKMEHFYDVYKITVHFFEARVQPDAYF